MPLWGGGGGGVCISLCIPTPVVHLLKISLYLCYLWVALAVYNRSPSAYEALRGLQILQLPHSKTMKEIIKDGSENPCIDEEYLLGQHKTFVKFQKEREQQGYPRPLGLGVMMWDEVKVRARFMYWNLKCLIMHTVMCMYTRWCIYIYLKTLS